MHYYAVYYCSYSYRAVDSWNCDFIYHGRIYSRSSCDCHYSRLGENHSRAKYRGRVKELISKCGGTGTSFNPKEECLEEYK